MSFNFVKKVFSIGGSDVPSPIQFYKRGFNLGGSSSPSWQDIILSGFDSLTLTNAKANGLNYLKLFGGTEQRNLPSEYTQVEYIESTGTQYIDTGITPTSNKLQINCKMQRTTDIYSNFFGAVAGTSPRDGVRAYMQLETARMLFQSGAGSKTFTFTTGLEMFEIKSTLVNGGNATIVVNGDTQTFSDVNTTLSTSMLIGAARVGSGSNGIGTFKIWEFEIIKDDVRFFKGIPCKNSSNKFGLFDIVSGNFFVSESSDDFIGGNEIIPTPETPMNIICNNGDIKVSPNLFNVANVSENKSINQSGAISDSTVSMISDFIPVKEGYAYIQSGTTGTSGGADVNVKRWHGYDSNKDWVQQLASDSFAINAPFTQVIQIPYGIKYVRISESKTDTNIQFEQGKTATTYRPYGQIYFDGTAEIVMDNLGNTATAQNLLSVDDFADIQEILSGAVTRNIGVKVFDGTENWTYNATNSVANLIIDDMYYGNGSSNITIKGLSTHYVGTTAVNASMPDNSIKYSNTTTAQSTARAFIKTTETSLASFKQFLADQYANGTPVIMLYPLFSSVSEKATNQLLTTKAGTNTMQITQASMSGLSLEASYKANDQN